MKLVRSAPLAFVTFCLTAMVLLGAPSAQAQYKTQKALVRALEGSATWQYGKDTGSVQLKHLYPAGTVIKTSPGSHVDLYLGNNGPFLRVTENSNLTIDRLRFRSAKDEVIIDTGLNLRRGRILGQVKKTSSSSRYEVVTPTMVAGIRGTTYDISVDGTTKVFDGQVVVAYAMGNQTPTYLINSGFKFNPNNQQVIQLDPGDINPVFNPFDPTGIDNIIDGKVITPAPGPGPDQNPGQNPDQKVADTGTPFISPDPADPDISPID